MFISTPFTSWKAELTPLPAIGFNHIVLFCTAHILAAAGTGDIELFNGSKSEPTGIISSPLRP